MRSVSNRQRKISWRCGKTSLENTKDFESKRQQTSRGLRASQIRTSWFQRSRSPASRRLTTEKMSGGGAFAGAAITPTPQTGRASSSSVREKSRQTAKHKNCFRRSSDNTATTQRVWARILKRCGFLFLYTCCNNSKSA